MSIHEDISFDNQGEPIHKSLVRTLFLPVVIVLVALLCFGIGRLSAGQGSTGVKIENSVSTTTAAAVQATSIAIPVPNQAQASGSVYASSKGKKYYYPNCHSTVSAANKITFATAALAEKAGFTLATNCHP